MKGNIDSPIQQTYPRIKHLYWKAVFVGSIVALGITFLFNLLTIGVGFALFNRTPDGIMALTFATVAWMVVGSYMTLFVAGWISGRLVYNEYSFHLANGMLHGFVTWSLYLIISIILLGLMSQAASAAILKSFFINIPIDNITHMQGTAATDVHKLGYATIVTFFIFFIGAVGCCIGASCGIKESKKCHNLKYPNF